MNWSKKLIIYEILLKFNCFEEKLLDTLYLIIIHNCVFPTTFSFTIFSWICSTRLFSAASICTKIMGHSKWMSKFMRKNLEWGLFKKKNVSYLIFHKSYIWITYSFQCYSKSILRIFRKLLIVDIIKIIPWK